MEKHYIKATDINIDITKDQATDNFFSNQLYIFDCNSFSTTITTFFNFQIFCLKLLEKEICIFFHNNLKDIEPRQVLLNFSKMHNIPVIGEHKLSLFLQNFNSYDILSQYYDQLQSDIDFQKWFSLLPPNFKQLQTLDFGCGTAPYIDQFNNFNYTGLDLSSNMIDKAKIKHPSYQFINCDLKSIADGEQYDLVISLMDVINYITDENELQLIFAKIASILKANGYFLFDIHTEKYAEFFADYEYSTEVTAGIFNWKIKTSGDRIYHVIYLQKANDEVIVEVHEQKIYKKAQIEAMLKLVGLKLNKSTYEYNHEIMVFRKEE